ncbi:MAG: serine protease [Candidatus Baltobacteraceae bacterium]
MLRSGAGLAAAMLLAIQPAAAAGSAFEQLKGSLALIGYPVDDKKLTMAFGTGFCVSSSPTKSYFVTNNHVVTDALGNVAPNIFAILPKSPETRYKATIVRRSPDPDLAVISIDAACDATVKVSPSVPEAGDDIAIAGFPYTEVCELAGLCSAGLIVPDAHKGRLVPILSRGTVNEAQEGTYAIIYDALADHGNSGGPLFDYHSGAVYGVVVDALPGYADEGAPPQREFNRAIAMDTGLKFINDAPVQVAMDQTSGGARGVGGAQDRYTAAALGSSECRIAWRGFDQAYGEWAQLHGKLQSLADFVAEPGHEDRRSELQPLAATLATNETAVLTRLRAKLSGLQEAKATNILARATALSDAVATSTSSDAALAASLGTAPKPAAGSASAVRLREAAQEMDAVSTCL